jgi:hypothetical protein
VANVYSQADLLLRSSNPDNSQPESIKQVAPGTALQ